MRRFLSQLSLGHVALFLGLFLSLQLVGRDRMLRDPGTFWHTVVGERILRTAAVPRADWLSFTQAGVPWIAQQWLGEIVMAGLHRVGGLDSLLLASTALLAGTYCLVGGRLRRAGIAWRWAVVLVLLTIAASSYHFLARPHLFTISAMAIVYALLCDVESGKLSIRVLWLLPFIIAIWANIHGGALGGLATILFVMGGWGLRRHASGAAHRRSTVILYGAVSTLCIVAVLVNPYGAALPATWLRLMSSSVLPQMIVEHARMDPWSFEGAMLIILASIYGWVLRAAWRSGRRITWIVPLLWLPLAISRVRHGPLFALTAILAIAEMWPYVQASRDRTTGSDASQGLERGYLGAALPVCLCLMIGLIVQGSGATLPLIGRGWANISPEYWPVGTVDALRAQCRGLDRPPRVFNDMLFGGYLIYQAPEARVFIDDRCELYGDAGLVAYARLCRVPNEFDALAAYDGYDYAIVQRDCLLDAHMAANESWRPLASDRVARLYVRFRG